MTLFDLLFLLCALVAIGALLRAGYLLARRRTGQAGALIVRLGAATAVYLAVVLVVSLASPGREIARGAPHCFDDFCITIDSAVRTRVLGTTSSDEDFVVVSGRLSTTARRRQRETDIRGALLDEHGRTFAVSARGQQTLEMLGEAGSALNDFVEPMGQNPFKLAFEVPRTSRTLRFVTKHGWFPGAIIIAGEESLLHRPAVVNLSE